MKRFVLIGLMLIGSGTITYAQNDDIYSNGQDQRGGQKVDKSQNNNGNDQQNNASQGNNAQESYQSNNNPDDYVDYDDDSYSSRINRFDNSFGIRKVLLYQCWGIR